jgi:hypothetical protein
MQKKKTVSKKLSLVGRKVLKDKTLIIIQKCKHKSQCVVKYERSRTKIARLHFSVGHFDRHKTKNFSENNFLAARVPGL